MPLFKGFCLAGLLLLSIYGAISVKAAAVNRDFHVRDESGDLVLSVPQEVLEAYNLTVTGGAYQEQLGKVIVMMASGWYEWPALPQCTYDQKGRFTNTPCLYGGTAYGLKKIVPLEESTVEEELPSWLWRISR